MYQTQVEQLKNNLLTMEKNQLQKIKDEISNIEGLLHSIKKCYYSEADHEFDQDYNSHVNDLVSILKHQFQHTRAKIQAV